MTYSKTIATLFLTSIVATSLSTQHAAAAPGFQTNQLKVEHRDAPLKLHIWYPTEQSGVTEMMGKNAVFTGVEIRPNATPLKGNHPLVVLSHGSGGNAVNIAWIAAELADRGMIVVATNHPSTTSGNSIQKETIKLWERPQDLSAITDHAENDGFGAIKIDNTKIAAVGFSLGGHSVLSIAGARVSQAKYKDYCTRLSFMMDCTWLKAGGVDFSKIDPAKFEQSSLDKRIKTVVSIDPALSQAYNSESLKDISIPVQIINLGANETVPAAVNASKIAPLFRQAEIINVNQATHFSFLGNCTKIGEAIIKSEGEEPICSETGNRPRTDIHDELKKHIGNFLVKQLIGKS